MGAAGSPGGAEPDESASSARQRRFGGLERLYGAGALDRLAAAHACVVGLGGVGSWACEALARSGMGRLTLIDLDHVAESNINRQIQALGSTLGASKIETLRERVALISPDCQVDLIDDFIAPDNAARLLPADCLVIDAIDQPRAKAALIALAVSRAQGLIVCGAAGGRSDPLRLRREDLGLTKGDALLASVRARLRREYGFARGSAQSFGIPAISSDESPAALVADGCEPGSPLACSGYGSSVAVTAAMGFAAAAWLIEAVVRPASSRSRRR